MIIEKLQLFAEAVSVRLYVKRPAPMEQDWRLDNWDFPCIVAIPAQESETVQETSGRVERREFDLMALRSVDVTFDTSEADASTEIARTDVLDFAQQMRGVFHVEHLGGRQIWDSANGELIVGWSLRLRLTELVGESACGGEPEPAEIEITKNGTYNVLPFGRAVVDVQGGTPAVVEPLEVTPDNEQHTYNPPAGVDGFAPVVVGACPVCPAPLLQAKTAEPATTAQVVTADEGYDGLSSVTVDAVTAAIDANITPGNIKKDVQILGVMGTMKPESESDNVLMANLLGSTWASSRSLAGFPITEVVDRYGYCTALGQNVLRGSDSIECVNLPSCWSVNTQAITNNTALKEILLPAFTSPVGNYQFSCQNNVYEKIVVGALTTWPNLFYNYNCEKLRIFEVGTGTAVGINLTRWTATDVIAEGQSGIDELNYNIKTYIADKVADRTNDTALTITFGASLYNVLTAETLAAFTAKNWNVASA